MLVCELLACFAIASHLYSPPQVSFHWPDLASRAAVGPIVVLDYFKCVLFDANLHIKPAGYDKHVLGASLPDKILGTCGAILNIDLSKIDPENFRSPDCTFSACMSGTVQEDITCVETGS